jgi:hypothetical protein
MVKELLKLAAAALGAAVLQIVEAVQAGSALNGKLIVSILVGTVIVRLAMWVVATFGPKPA